MAFTQNFNYCMEQRGYSAYKFAQIIGASNQGVLNWQSGDSKPYPKTQKKIADHFGITVEALNGEELPTLPPQVAKKAPTETSEREFVPSYEDWEKQAESWTDDQLMQAMRKLLDIQQRRRDDGR